jgi:hypothetical protein
VSEWLGHADPAFTLRTHVHLLDEGIREGLDLGVGNGLGNATPGNGQNRTEVRWTESAD